MKFDKESERNFKEYNEIGKGFPQNEPSYHNFLYVYQKFSASNMVYK